MNPPNEPQFPYTTSLDSSSSPLDADWATLIADHPVGALLAAAALGAGAMALVSLSAPAASARKRFANDASGLRASASDEVDALKKQVSDLARRVLDGTPSKKEAAKQANALGDRALDAWNEVRDQATSFASDMAGRLRPQVAEMAGRLRPRVEAATDIAKENPLWVGLAMGALAAFLGSRVLGRADD